MLSSQSAISLDMSTIRACVKTRIKCWLGKVAAGLKKSHYIQAWTTLAIDINNKVRKISQKICNT